MRTLLPVCIIILLFAVTAPAGEEDRSSGSAPYLLCLGIAQDGGVPQAGSKEHTGWNDERFRRLVVSFAVVDPVTTERWLIDCTPDFPEQLHLLDEVAPADSKPGLSGIFLTHAHIGHYTGLVHLGHEVMGSREVPVYAMPQLADFLGTNGPWDQLVRYKNISLVPLNDGAAVRLNGRLEITPFLVPHRQEYSEVVGFRIDGPKRSAVIIPDIDSWREWDEMGTRIEDVIAGVDIAYLDGTFYDNGEIPGRDMSAFPHPFIAHTMARLAPLPLEERSKVRFIHLNHTNPALDAGSTAEATIKRNGFALAVEGERFEL